MKNYPVCKHPYYETCPQCYFEQPEEVDKVYDEIELPLSLSDVLED